VADLLKQGSDWLEDQRHKHLSRTVTYRRGAVSVEISATVGRTTFEIDSGTGFLERIESRDYLVLSADLVLGGQATLPERGDLIVETDGSAVFSYEVTAPGTEPAWRYSDPYRKTLRIHTKLVESS
jgi:hypothetical protein